MYGNNFFNPYTYRAPYQAANFTSNLTRNSTNLASGFGRNASLASGLGKTSGLGNLLGKFSFTGFLNGASKTLNIINQAIPVFYQVKPMINNAKTMFRVMSAVKDDKPTKKQTTQNTFSNEISINRINSGNETKKIVNNVSNDFKEENPTFFI